MDTMTAAQRNLAELVTQISDERLLDRAMGDWTGKDLLAHLACWHDHSVLVIESLRAGRPPYDRADPANRTDAFNDRFHREHVDDPPGLERRELKSSFDRLLAALGSMTDADLFEAGRWPWLEGEALVELVLWDTSRHYDAHLEHLKPLAQNAAT